MILGENNISIMDVRNALGYPSMDLGTLCSCGNVNKWSRYRPGYWEGGTAENLIFHIPKGGNYNDPRGSDANGISIEVYKLGDFRCYNTSAKPPFINGMNPRDMLVPSNHSGVTVTDEIVFDLGEVDWFGDEAKYWGRNYIGGVNQIIAVDVSLPNAKKILGYCDKSNLISDGNRRRAEFNVNLTVPASSSAVNVVKIQFALGANNKPRFYIPDTELIINARRVSGAQYLIYPTSAGLQSLYTRIAPYLSNTDTSCYDVQLMPSNGTVTAGLSTINYVTTDTIVTAYPSYSQYRVTTARWNVSYTVKVINQSTNAQVETFTGSGTWAINGTGRYYVSIPLNSVAKDNHLYRVELTSFGNTTVEPI